MNNYFNNLFSKSFIIMISFLIYACCIFYPSNCFSETERGGVITLKNSKKINFYKIDQPIAISGRLDGAPIKVEFKYLNKIILIDDTTYECFDGELGEIIVINTKNKEFNIKRAYFCFGDKGDCGCGGGRPSTGVIHYTTYNPISEISKKQRISIKEIAKIRFEE
ncbi:hypothetical protein AKJ60_00130 [candidate division MSBL1 archaeon SCGC-AAA385M11]|nr:hypothetical protein AKJ60_00130 [candidate division MSBL1 archaeon SCGC-AAA385M11]